MAKRTATASSNTKMTTLKLPKKAIIPDGFEWTVEYHNGKTSFNPSSLSLHLEPEQEKGYLKGDILAKRMKRKGLNANALEYLLKHPDLIPEDWKEEYVYFWGTIYRSADGNLYVRCLCWSGDRWSWYCHWLVSGFHGCDPAAVSASSPRPSDPSPYLSLDLAIEQVKKAGYKVIKEL